VTLVDKRTGRVVTVKVALVDPDGIVTLVGTPAISLLLLESAITAPPAGAGPLSVTVPVEDSRPVTLEGLNVSAERTGGRTVIAAV